MAVNTSKSITFPVAFSNAALDINFIAIFSGNPDADSSGHWVKSYTKTNFVMTTNWGNKNISVFWSARGK